MTTPSDHDSGKSGTYLTWAVVESGGLSVLSLLTLLILARVVGPKDFGLAALALGVVHIASIVSEMLMHDAVVQRRDLDRRHLDTAFWASAGMGAAMLALCVIGAVPFARAFEAEELAPIVMVTAVSLLFSSIGGVPMALLRRAGDFKALALRSLYGRIAGTVAALALAVFGFGVWSIVVQHLVYTAVGAALIWPAIDWRPSLTFCRRRLGDLLSFAIPSVAGRVMWVVAVRLFTVAYGYLFGITAAGYLNIAQRIVDTLYDTLGGAAYNAALPLFARRQADPQALLTSCKRAIEFAAAVTLPIFTGLSICAPSIIVVFLGEEWRPAAMFMRVLAIGATINFLFLLPGVALIAAGWPSAILALSVVSFTFVFASLFVLQPDALGAVMIWAARVMATVPLMALCVWRLFRASANDLMDGIAVPLMAASAMAILLSLLQEYMLKGASDLATLAVTVPVGALIYVSLIVAIRRDLGVRVVAVLLSGLRAFRTT